MKKFNLLSVLLFILLPFVLSGCYINKEVESHQVGLKMSDGVKVDAVVGPGRESDWG